MLDTFFFCAFALLTVAGALLAVTMRSAVHCAVWLISSLLGTAGLFLMQQAEFLFAAQIVLYVGGIMVLFLFVIMLVNLEAAARERQLRKRWPIALAGVLLLAAGLARSLEEGIRLPAPRTAAETATGNVQQIAQSLFGEYLLPFEIASVLLLVAIVGAIVMAQREDAR